LLTDIKIKNAKAGKHSDGRGDGLILLVRSTGAKFWVQRLKVGDKYRDIGHGTWPEVTLADARRRAETTKAQASAGLEPVAARKAARAALPTGHTLAEAVEGHIAAHAPSWRGKKTANQFRSRLEQHAGDLMQRDPASITLEDVQRVLQPIWTSTPVVAQKVRSHLEHALEWATAAGWRTHGVNPAAWKGALRPLLAKPAKVTRNRHNPALPWQQVPAFMAALQAEDLVSARCLELCVLTAVRSGEARGAEWSEVDLKAAVWTIPASRTKAGREHRVPLSPAAVRLLKGMTATRSNATDLIFLNRSGGAFSDMALLALVKRLDAYSTRDGGKGWRDERGERITPHGFRSTFRDWCGERGKPRELAEAALAHAIGSATEQAYSRSDLLERRRVLMNEWASHVEGGK
jgi:integrase